MVFLDAMEGQERSSGLENSMIVNVFGDPWSPIHSLRLDTLYQWALVSRFNFESYYVITYIVSMLCKVHHCEFFWLADLSPEKAEGRQKEGGTNYPCTTMSWEIGKDDES